MLLLLLLLLSSMHMSKVTRVSSVVTHLDIWNAIMACPTFYIMYSACYGYVQYKWWLRMLDWAPWWSLYVLCGAICHLLMSKKYYIPAEAIAIISGLCQLGVHNLDLIWRATTLHFLCRKTGNCTKKYLPIVTGCLFSID